MNASNVLSYRRDDFRHLGGATGNNFQLEKRPFWPHAQFCLGALVFRVDWQPWRSIGDLVPATASLVTDVCDWKRDWV